MPSPRVPLPRPVPPVQVLARNRETGRMSGPFRGRPVAIRNGLPATRLYVYRGAGYCMTKEEAAACLS